jgi:hypothetical protein
MAIPTMAADPLLISDSDIDTANTVYPPASAQKPMGTTLAFRTSRRRSLRNRNACKMTNKKIRKGE